MPAVEGCRQPEIPSAEAWEWINESPIDWGQLPGIYCLYIAAYLYGLLCVFVAALDFTNDQHISRKTWILLLPIIPVIILLLFAAYQLIIDFVNDPTWPTWIEYLPIALFIAMCFGLVNGLWALNAGRPGWLTMKWNFALAVFMWFSFWVLPASIYGNEEELHYGIYCSWAGALMLLVAATKEARLRSPWGLFKTIRYLITTKWYCYPLDTARCIFCGYILEGLTNPRCPECGLEFDAGQWSHRAVN